MRADRAFSLLPSSRALRVTLFFITAFLLLHSASSASAEPILRGVTVHPSIGESDIEDLSDWGVNVVRFPLSRDDSSHYEDRTRFFRRLDAALEAFDRKLPMLKDKGILVILELGSPPGGFGAFQGKPQHRLFSEPWAQEAFVTAWAKIADRYKQEPGIWGYDLLNEPAQNKVKRGLLDWNKLALAAGQAVRAADTERRIIVESIYGNPVLFRRLKRLPLTGVVYSAHMYYTLRFQHQGLDGNPLGVSYPGKRFNKRSLATHLKPVQKFARKYGAEIYIGEFSAVRWAPGESAYRYLMDTLELFEERGWHYTYHAFREANPWSVEHGPDFRDPEPVRSRTDREMLLRQYFGRNE